MNHHYMSVCSLSPTVIAMDRLTWSDYLILVAFLVISLGIGVYHSLTGGRQRTTSEFIVANRSLKVLPTALSLLVSFQSAILVLGTTAEMYSYGVQLLIMNLILFVPVILLTMQVAVPWIYPLKLVSINEVKLISSNALSSFSTSSSSSSSTSPSTSSSQRI